MTGCNGSIMAGWWSDSWTWTVGFSLATAISGASSLCLLEWRSTFCTSGIEDVRKRRIWICVWFQENSRVLICCSLFGGLEDLLEVKPAAIAGHLQGCPSMSHPKGRSNMARSGWSGWVSNLWCPDHPDKVRKCPRLIWLIYDLWFQVLPVGVSDSVWF